MPPFEKGQVAQKDGEKMPEEKKEEVAKAEGKVEETVKQEEVKETVEQEKTDEKVKEQKEEVKTEEKKEEVKVEEKKENVQEVKEEKVEEAPVEIKPVQNVKNRPDVRIEKVIIHVGVGEPGQPLENAKKIVEELTGRKCVYTKGKIKEPKWGIRPGLPIGVKTTLRKEDAEKFLNRALEPLDHTLKKRQFDLNGNFGFGIKEHIELPDVKYDPNLGIIGMDILVNLERAGYAVKRRKLKKASIGKRHLISKEEAMDFVKQKFNVKIE